MSDYATSMSDLTASSDSSSDEERAQFSGCFFGPPVTELEAQMPEIPSPALSPIPKRVRRKREKPEDSFDEPFSSKLLTRRVRCHTTTDGGMVTRLERDLVHNWAGHPATEGLFGPPVDGFATRPILPNLIPDLQQMLRPYPFQTDGLTHALVAKTIQPRAVSKLFSFTSIIPAIDYTHPVYIVFFGQTTDCRLEMRRERHQVLSYPMKMNDVMMLHGKQFWYPEGSTRGINMQISKGPTQKFHEFHMGVFFRQRLVKHTISPAMSPIRRRLKIEAAAMEEVLNKSATLSLLETADETEL